MSFESCPPLSPLPPACTSFYPADRSSSSDTDTETDRQVAAREMVRSQENPDQRYRSPTTTEEGRGAEEQGGRRRPPQNEEEEEDEERKGTANSQDLFQPSKSHVYYVYKAATLQRYRSGQCYIVLLMRL